MGQTRRSLLKRGLLGGALLGAAGGIGLSLRSTRLVEPQGPLAVLSVEEYSVLSAIAARMIPSGEGFPSPREIRTVEKVDARLAKLHPSNQAEMKLVITMIESATMGFALDLRLTPFTGLDGEAQDRALAAWRDSRILLRRSAHHAIRAFVTMAYYGSPETHAAVGYPGPPEIAR